MNYDGHPGACSFRLRPKKGSDHIGSTLRGLFLHSCKSLFLEFEPVTSWSQGRRFTTATRLPFQKYELWWNLNLEFGGLHGGHGGRAPTPNFPYKCPKYCHCIEQRCMKDGGNSLCLFCHIIRAKGRRFLRSVNFISQNYGYFSSLLNRQWAGSLFLKDLYIFTDEYSGDFPTSTYRSIYQVHLPGACASTECDAEVIEIDRMLIWIKVNENVHWHLQYVKKLPARSRHWLQKSVVQDSDFPKL